MHHFPAPLDSRFKPHPILRLPNQIPSTFPIARGNIKGNGDRLPIPIESPPMISRNIPRTSAIALSTALLTLLSACSSGDSNIPQGLKITMLVGSALGDFCKQSAEKFNAQQPKLKSGDAFYLSCVAQGSGDVVDQVVSQAQQIKNGSLPADAPDIPTLISLDGDLYHEQLVRRIDALYPGQNYIPNASDSPLLANSPLVFMTSQELAPSLSKPNALFKALATAKTHKDLDPSAPAQTIHYVHTAPTRSNSGLQTLIAQFTEISGKRPEDLSLADITSFQGPVTEIQKKITRYGLSTNSLALAMAKNGPFWASVGSVYESSVIAANSNRPASQPLFQAVYPPATFTANMRAAIPKAPWVSTPEREAAEQILAYLQSPDAQQIAVSLGLRPGNPAVALGPKFTPEFGVNPNATYDTYRAPKPEVVAAMLKSWENTAKKPSLVVVVVDSSGSMSGDKLPSVQNTLKTYIEGLGPKDQIALIDFDGQVRAPVRADGTPEGRDRGLQFISSLKDEGSTKLYDASLAGRNWLQQNLRPEAINAVLVLTDGEDSGSSISIDQLQQELKKSGFTSDQRIGFFTIGYGEEGDFNPEVLKAIAEQNGGYYSQGKPDTIAQVLSKLQLEF
jgi:Ca-activated chloride channel homolog